MTCHIYWLPAPGPQAVCTRRCPRCPPQSPHTTCPMTARCAASASCGPRSPLLGSQKQPSSSRKRGEGRVEGGMEVLSEGAQGLGFEAFGFPAGEVEFGQQP